MHVSVATLCDEVRTRPDGRVDLLGVAGSRIMVDALPWQGRLTFALVLELGDDDVRDQKGMNVSVIRLRDGAVVGTVAPGAATQARDVPSDAVGPVQLAFELGLDTRFDVAGNHQVLVRRPDGTELASTAFSVALRS